MPREYVDLLGLYTGDPHISHVHRGVYRLRIALDLRYPHIIDSAAAAIHDVQKRKPHVQKQAGNWVIVTSYWSCWPCLFPQQGRRRAHG